jgi:hypothetical protein
MSEIEIVIAPVGNDRFTAHWGDILLTTSRTPFFASARKLIELGADPADVLTMRHAESFTVSLRTRVGVAAKLTVDEHGSRFAPWHARSEFWKATEDVV